MGQLTPAFVTGSRAYGTPTKDSDLDLVVLTDERTLELLKEEESFLGAVKRVLGFNSPPYPPASAHSFRFGNLNLIVCTTKAAYDMWKIGVEELSARAPVTREQAIEHYAKLRGEAGRRIKC